MLIQNNPNNAEGDCRPSQRVIELLRPKTDTGPSFLAGRDTKTPVEMVSEVDFGEVFRADAKEHDACALLAIVNRHGEATQANVKQVLDGLVKMSHRAGMVNGEGDGCGVMLDIPRLWWQNRLDESGIDGGLAWRDDFWVGHLLVKKQAVEDSHNIEVVTDTLSETGFKVLYCERAAVNNAALGPQGQAEEPAFWQLAGTARLGDERARLEQSLFRVQIALESEYGVHFASLSSYNVVYKLRGSPDVLARYFPDLNDPRLTSAATLGHSRYCTNTVSSFFRVQPFTVLGHNGEINTVARLEQEARMLGVALDPDGSDSQDLNRTIETLIHEYGFSLLEAMELAFPPIVNEIKQLEPDLQNLYVYLRQGFGPFAQGPAGIISRYGNECVFAVDALGLRPLWFGAIESDYFFSSEKGLFPLDDFISDPKPLSPGEKIYVRLQGAGNEPQVWSYPKMQQEALRLLSERLVIPKDTAKLIAFSQPPATLPDDDTALRLLPESRAVHADNTRNEVLMAATGWSGDDLHYLEFLAETGNEPIGSLGYDGPLAALNKERHNLTDFFKENVAVVTNPAIDREREIEHFSTRVALGGRPSLARHEVAHTATGTLRPSLGGTPNNKIKARPSRMVEISCPVLLGGHAGREQFLLPNLYWEAARASDTYLLEELVEFVSQNGFRPEAVCILSNAFDQDEAPPDVLRRLSSEAIRGVEAGAKIVLIDDTEALDGDGLWLDPILVVAAVDEALRHYRVPASATTFQPSQGNFRNLRREASIVLRAANIRNLHDLIIAFGMGADAINPYLMIEVAASRAATETINSEARQHVIKKHIENLVEGLKKGLEKVSSTMGIHELRGYGRLFASIGLAPEISRYFGTHNFAGSSTGGFGWTQLVADAISRRHILTGDTEPKMARDYHLYPKVWKAAGAVATGASSFEKYEAAVLNLEAEDPISLRHLLDIKLPAASEVQPEEVDLSVERHALPVLISSMSFGSQGETAYKAYAEAGQRLNIVALNGEGGEVKEILGRYYHIRGVQIASGRFGVNIELLNSAHLLEIKVGQGAKPGEGGHLPGSKVSAKVAAARNALPKVDLISPSNNHDIYSIEDLAQFISELKTANPDARVAVKVPIVSGIGTIAVGIAKAGADIITLSGFDGGTGAARSHALKYVGLPAEIGVTEAHRALVQAGLRDTVEIWCDGGMKHATDVVKMVCLGANRVGFGTMAMVAIGCTICRACQKDTCHVGIATQIETEEEAKERGLKRFIPQEEERAVGQLVRVFSGLGQQLRVLTARLGFRRLQDLVGRSDLLEQVRGLAQADMQQLLAQDAAWTARQLEIVAGRGYQACFPCAVTPNVAFSGSATRRITGEVKELVAAGGGRNIFYEGIKLDSVDRSVGTHLSGTFIREGWGAGPSFARNYNYSHPSDPVPTHVALSEEPIRGEETVNLELNSGSIPGNGLAAFNSRRLKIVVHGGAQDGVGKGSLGGSIVVMKGQTREGKRVDGSVGKSFGYGAQRGLFLVQGNADSRFCIRLSGADVVIGGEVTEPLDDSLGYIGARSNLKGFAFEYMTNGRAIVLGDPGPWVCSGMTGGIVYLRLQPEMGLDLAALKRRLAKGAKVGMSRLNDADKAGVRELLGYYWAELELSGQADETQRLVPLLAAPEQHFVKVQPVNMQVDPSISTE